MKKLSTSLVSRMLRHLGYEVIVAERLLERQPDLRVLFMSGYTEDALLRRRDIPARVAFIEKPFTAAQLGQALHELAAS